MYKIVVEQIAELIKDNRSILRLAIRQRAKFEGWLKFELAARLDKLGLENVEVETKIDFKRSRPDISFQTKDFDFYKIELKTCNTSWKIDGIETKGKPISGNIKSIIKDTKKLNSNYGIVAFVMFPIPLNDTRWKEYIERIKKETEVEINYTSNCKLLKMKFNEKKYCNILICSYMSKIYNNCF